MNGTAFGNGHDTWWYVNGGAGQTASRELYQMQPQLVSGPMVPRLVIELIGSGARSIEDSSVGSQRSRGSEGPAHWLRFRH